MERQSRRPTHRLYIDDSGTKEYSPDGRYDAGNTRYFVLGGVLVAVGAEREIGAVLRSVKERHFGLADVEVKSNWLRMPEERRRRYLAPYGLDDGQLMSFTDEYYEHLLELEFTLVASVVDKRQMVERYREPWAPPRVAYDLLLQRAQLEMEGEGFCAVEMDEMGGATRSQHARLLQDGSELQRDMAFDRLVGNLRFVDSAQSELVQVADLAAYNVFRQFTEHGEAQGVPGQVYEYFQRLSGKFRSDASGRIQGHGIAKMPMHRP